MSSRIDRPIGITPSERLLAEISEHSFLDLWSWPNVYKSPGKELCDLLVVCGNDVIIFSDKSIEWPPGDIQTAWRRWFSRAIGKSVSQISGADRWLRSNPSEIYADPKCKQRIPLELPTPERRRVHGVCVTFGAEGAASAYFNDPDGTLLIYPYLRGDDHIDFTAKGHLPFAVGDVHPNGPFMHVFNLVALGIVMDELNTITDFVEYLTEREKLVRSGRLFIAPSEMEMLAHYLMFFRDGKRGFPLQEDAGATADMKLQFIQGEYAEHIRSPEYQRLQKANRQSEIWDRTIRLFTEHVLKDTQYKILNVDPNFQKAERALRFMARENRFRRCSLGRALSEALISQARQGAKLFARIVLPNAASITPDLAYIFMILPQDDQFDLEFYRKSRSLILETYCLSVLHDHRELAYCVGLAMSSLADEIKSEDLIALEQLEWSNEQIKYMYEARQHYEILTGKGVLSKPNMTFDGFAARLSSAGLTRRELRATKRAFREKLRRRR